MKTFTASTGILFLLLMGSFLGGFGDEVDNYLGGKIIAQGGALYRDYWSHHMPLAYQLSAILYTAGARTYLQFRLLYALLVWLSGMALYRYLRQSMVLAVWLVLALVAPVLGNHMLLAESVIGYLTIAAFLLIRAGHVSTLPVIVLLLWGIPAAGLKQVYLALFLFLLMTWQYRTHGQQIMVSLVLPALLSALYLLVYRSGSEMIEQAYVFNQTYYPAYYYGSADIVHPVNALVNQVFGIPRSLLRMPTTQDAPLLLTLCFGMVLTGIYLIRRRWYEAALVAVVVMFTFPTGAAQYAPSHHFIAHYMAITGVAVYAVGSFWQSKSAAHWKAGAGVLLALALLPGMAWQTNRRVDEPPPYAAIVNALTRPGDRVWYAPAEFGDWLMTNAPNAAAPYYFVYPWTWSDPAVRADLLARLQAYPPAVLVFHRSQPIAGVAGWELETFAPELTAWVDANYRMLPEYVDVYVLRR